MSSKRYPEEFRVETVKQITEHGPVFAAPDNIHPMMAEYRLLPEQFVGHYTKDID